MARRWMKLDGRLHWFWWRWGDAGLPLWPWRWVCWLNHAHVNDSYGSCAICFADLSDPEDKP